MGQAIPPNSVYRYFQQPLFANPLEFYVRIGLILIFVYWLYWYLRVARLPPLQPAFPSLASCSTRWTGATSMRPCTIGEGQAGRRGGGSEEEDEEEEEEEEDEEERNS
jgi:hypothetical protein